MIQTRKYEDPCREQCVSYISFPLVYAVMPEGPPCFLSLRFAAKSMLSMSDATVRTPPTTAQVLHRVASINKSG